MKGWEKIGQLGQKVFSATHHKHLASMGASEKKNYALDQVKEVKANNEEKCIDVRFKNGELFKYTPHGTWH
ncbi:hypothetical protein D7Z54_14400 [Salibacterium salarium]|uniref:Uncharacterized protein n=1 Tax=Salibacterium salarium TaxID=284579 RepID=A0A3R9P709_9BACI|nr:hypothetical protein [Salibacterium salarium]RSL32638.1 hypothetical protein D7Z54_14400 [Salibacterium salarium]